MGRVNREKRELSERGDGAGFDRRWTQMGAGKGSRRLDAKGWLMLDIP